jgi:CRP-like cAMP-binding protein
MDSLVTCRSATDREQPSAAAPQDRGDAVLSIFRAQSILGFLPERDRLALLRQSSTRSYPKNRALFRTGDQGRCVVLVLQGYVKLSTVAPNGREVVLEIAGPGSIFGELAVLNGSPRQADATTLTSCRVMAIDGGLFRRALAATPEAMFATIRLLSDRLSATTAREMDTVSLPAPVRLAKALLRLANLHSEHVGEGVQLGFRLSQRELGAMTGLIRESINKHLKAWRAAGWVELSGGNVTLRDVRALQAYVRGSEAQ